MKHNEHENYGDCNCCVHDDRNLEEYPCKECVKQYHIGNGTPYWAPAPEPEPEPEPVHSGVTVTMTCGERFHHDTLQPEVESVMVQGETIYPAPEVPEPKPNNVFDSHGKAMPRIEGEHPNTMLHGMPYWTLVEYIRDLIMEVAGVD